MENELLISADVVAKLLGVTVGTLSVWRCTRRYPLPYVKVGHLIRYRREDVTSFVASRVMNAPETTERTNHRRSKR
jgi:hypothetical protein